VSSVDDQAIAARRYQYLRNGKPLDVEVRYFVRTYRHVPSLIEDSTLLSTKPALRDRRHPKLGSYVLYPQQGNLHLSACLDPYGKTSVYDNEVMLHQARPEVVSQRLLPWILGQAPLRDLRCLWVDLSMPIAPGRFEVDRVDATPLEAAFGDWVEWWSQNYPTEPPT
jgi:cyanosortase A-associated protein